MANSDWGQNSTDKDGICQNRKIQTSLPDYGEVFQTQHHPDSGNPNNRSSSGFLIGEDEGEKYESSGLKVPGALPGNSIF